MTFLSTINSRRPLISVLFVVLLLCNTVCSATAFGMQACHLDVEPASKQQEQASDYEADGNCNEELILKKPHETDSKDEFSKSPASFVLSSIVQSGITLLSFYAGIQTYDLLLTQFHNSSTYGRAPPSSSTFS